MRWGTFHEGPLVAFTTLAILGAGQLAGPLVSWAAGQSASSPRLVALAGTLLLAAGLGVSLLHLGRPWLSPLALRRTARSRLSTEVALAACLLAAATLTVLADGAAIVAGATGLIAVGFLLALGGVYNLRGQRAWRGPWVLTPCLLGLAAGALGVAASAGAGDGITAAAALLIGMDAAVLLGHWMLVGKPGGLPHTSRKPGGLPHTSRRPGGLPHTSRRPGGLPHTSRRPGGLPHTSRRPGGLPHTSGKPGVRPLVLGPAALLGARLALANVLAASLVVFGRPAFALALLALGVFADRLAFYLLAAPHTTEAEIARVEALMQ